MINRQVNHMYNKIISRQILETRPIALEFGVTNVSVSEIQYSVTMTKKRTSGIPVSIPARSLPARSIYDRQCSPVNPLIKNRNVSVIKYIIESYFILAINRCLLSYETTIVDGEFQRDT